MPVSTLSEDLNDACDYVSRLQQWFRTVTRNAKAYLCQALLSPGTGPETGSVVQVLNHDLNHDMIRLTSSGPEPVRRLSPRQETSYKAGYKVSYRQ